jgi:hypothetical protein
LEIEFNDLSHEVFGGLLEFLESGASFKRFT